MNGWSDDVPAAKSVIARQARKSGAPGEGPRPETAASRTASVSIHAYSRPKPSAAPKAPDFVTGDHLQVVVQQKQSHPETS